MSVDASAVVSSVHGSMAAAGAWLSALASLGLAAGLDVGSGVGVAVTADG
jgi:hypothetical protein